MISLILLLRVTLFINFGLIIFGYIFISFSVLLVSFHRILLIEYFPLFFLFLNMLTGRIKCSISEISCKGISKRSHFIELPLLVHTLGRIMNSSSRWVLWVLHHISDHSITATNVQFLYKVDMNQKNINQKMYTFY